MQNPGMTPPPKLPIPKGGEGPRTSVVSGKKKQDSDFEFLQIFADVMQRIYDAVKSNSLTPVLLYQMFVAGEIVAATSKAKLSDEVRKLLPTNVCPILQDIRDRYLGHSGFLMASHEREILGSFKINPDDFKLLADIANKIVIRESNQLICAKLQEFCHLEDGRRSKMNDILKEIPIMMQRAPSSIAKLSEKDKLQYIELQKQFTALCEEITNSAKEALKKDIEAKNKLTTHSDLLRKSEEFKAKITRLSELQNATTKIELLPAHIREFCSGLHNHVKYLEKETKQTFSSSTIIAERKEALTELLKAKSRLLLELVDKLKTFKEEELNNPQQHPEVLAVQHNIRWQLAIINALFEDLDIRSTTHFHKTRNDAIHNFLHIKPNDELQNLVKICAEDLSPFNKPEKKEVEASKRKTETRQESSPPPISKDRKTEDKDEGKDRDERKHFGPS